MWITDKLRLEGIIGASGMAGAGANQGGGSGGSIRIHTRSMEGYGTLRVT